MTNLRNILANHPATNDDDLEACPAVELPPEMAALVHNIFNALYRVNEVAKLDEAIIIRGHDTSEVSRPVLITIARVK